jgi:hypothetical protein
LPEAHEGDLRETARAFAEWVGDLPASERHHDAGPFGLLAHSLLASEIAARRAAEERLAAEVGLALWAFALTHDIGKAAMVRVWGPGGVLWNPYLEPVTAFYLRHGSERCGVRWMRGRAQPGLHWEVPALMMRVLPSGILEAIGPEVLTEVLVPMSDVGRQVVELVGVADREAARLGGRRLLPP